MLTVYFRSVLMRTAKTNLTLLLRKKKPSTLSILSTLTALFSYTTNVAFKNTFFFLCITYEKLFPSNPNGGRHSIDGRVKLKKVHAIGKTNGLMNKAVLDYCILHVMCLYSKRFVTPSDVT